MNFNDEGLLPPGDYEMSIEELKSSILVEGNGRSENWDREHRVKLVDNLEILANHLVQVGIDYLYVDGSFVEDKNHPNDIDGFFICEDLYLLHKKV